MTSAIGTRARFGGRRAWWCVFAIASAASAQYAVSESLRAPTPTPGFGLGLAVIGDITGDGLPEVAVGSPGTPFGPVGGGVVGGPVQVFTAATGALVLTVFSPPGDEHFGADIAAVGDVNLDGKPDFVVGSPRSTGTGAGSVRCISGADGSTLFLTSCGASDPAFGAAVAPAGDVNLDGIQDVIVGSPQVYNAPTTPVYLSQTPGAAYLVSGATGGCLRTYSAGIPYDGFGRSAGGAGDVNGDGVPDALIGAVGFVRVYSGANGALLYGVSSTASTPDDYGAAVASIGDVNFDGRPDFVVGAPGLGQVRTYSGLNGAAIATATNISAGLSGFGRAVARAGDIDGNGIPDVVAGAGTTVGAIGGVAVVTISGAVLVSATPPVIYSSTTPSSLGLRVTPAVDLNGDGAADVLAAGADSEGGIVASLTTGAAPPAPLVGTNGFERYGASAASVGDFDGDAIEDFVVGAPRADLNGLRNCGAVFIRSDAGGGAGVVAGAAAGEELGARVAGLGDVDGDGTPDFAALLSPVAPSFHAIRVFTTSGATIFGVPWTLSAVAPTTLFAAGDLDTDGASDFVVGAGAVVAGGLVSIVAAYSGANGAFLWTVASPSGPGPSGFGQSCARTADFDGDGVNDLLIGAPLVGGLPFVVPIGAVFLLSGATGALLLNVPLNPTTSPNVGAAIVELEDYTGDGLPEFGVLAPPAPLVGSIGPPRLFVYVGGTGVVWSVSALTPANPTSFITFNAAAPCGDVDGDGFTELVLAAGGTATAAGQPIGAVSVWSPHAGAPVSFEFGPGGSSYGASLALLGDRDGDGLREYVIGAPRPDYATSAPAAADWAYVRSVVGAAPASAIYGAGCTAANGVAPRVRCVGGAPSIAGNPDFGVCVLNAPPSRPAVLIAGLSHLSWSGGSLPLPLAAYGMPSCSLLISPDALHPFTTTSAGRAVIPLPVPANPALLGAAVWFQAFVLNPSGSFTLGATTDALRVVGE